MKKLNELEQILQYKFRDMGLLKTALTHSSYANEHHLNHNYDRLELMGDALIEVIVTAWLLNKYPDMAEGALTRLRAKIVCQSSLAETARSLKLDEFVMLGKGEAKIGGSSRDKLMCDLYEAVTGAIYMDGRFSAAKAFVEWSILHDNPAANGFTDYKTTLQEALGAEADELQYNLISATGPDHDKTFEVAIVLHGKTLGRGRGGNKKKAAQSAAAEALTKLNINF